MSNRIQATCPNCHAIREIPPGEVNLDRECERCHHRFAPSPADVTEEAPPSAGPKGPLPGEKVEVQCPGCLRILKVRRQYLGSAIICNRCDHKFFAPPGSGGESPPGPPGRVEGSRGPGDRPGPERLAFEAELGALVGRVGGIEARLAEIDAGTPGRDEDLRGVAAGLERHRGELAALAAGVSALRGELEAGRREAAAGIAEDRESARRQLESIRTEVEELRRQGAEAASRGVEADARSVALDSRLGPLEAAVRQGSDRASRLEAGLQAIGGERADRDALREDVERLRAENHALRQIADDQAEAFRAGLDALRDELASFRQAVDEREDRRDGLAAGLESLEASRLVGERTLSELREAIEAASLGSRGAIEQIRNQLGEVVRDQAEGRGRIEQSLEAERTSRREERESFLRQLETIGQDARTRDERVRSELDGLRAELSRRPSAPSAAASPPAAPEPRVVPTPPPSHLNRLALDMIFDRLDASGERMQADPPTAAIGITTRVVEAPGSPIPKATPAPSAVPDESERALETFTRLVDRGDLAGAIALARRLVAQTRDASGDRSLEHARWLRNLGLGLARGGNLAEACGSLQLALEICQQNPDGRPINLAILLIDLAEVCLAAGERRQARDICRQSLAILRANVGPDNPLLVAAQGCMARIGEVDPGRSAIETISIST